MVFVLCAHVCHCGTPVLEWDECTGRMNTTEISSKEAGPCKADLSQSQTATFHHCVYQVQVQILQFYTVFKFPCILVLLYD